MTDLIRITIREPRRTARWLTVFMGLFVVIGAPAMAVVMLSGSPGFAVLWGLGFLGAPLFVLWRLREDLQEADFVLDPHGIHSAHGRESLVAWEDVTEFVWRTTNTSVNDETLVRLSVQHLDGSETRISSLGLRRSTGEVSHVDDQLVAAVRSLGLPRPVRVAGTEVVATDVVGVVDDAAPSDAVAWPEDEVTDDA